MTIELSLNEFYALSRRALRGKGHHWGVCDDIAKASQYLIQSGFDGPKCIVGLLNSDFDHDGLYRLISMADLRLFADINQVIKECASPQILLGLIQMVLEPWDAPVTVIIDQFEFTVSNDGIYGPTTYVECATNFSLKQGAKKNSACVHRTNRAKIFEPDYKFMMEFAHKTYAPDTEERRLSGAGAGVSDND